MDDAARLARLEKVLDRLTDTVTVVDAEGVVQFTTAGSHGEAGYAPDFWENRNLWEILHPEDRAQVEAGLSYLVSKPGEVVYGDCSLKNSIGEWEPTSFSAANLLDDADVQGIVITSRSNRTERDALAAVDEAQQHRLDLAIERGRFVAKVTHELRSPLHAIVGLAELLAESSLDTEQRHMLTAIEREAQALKLIVDDVLDYSKVGDGKLELNEDPFSPGRLAAHLSDLIKPRADEAGLRLRVVVDQATPRAVRGDELRVRQVLMNLLTNAVKYTPQGEIEIKVAPTPDGVAFSVRDSGVGVPADKIPTLFDPFTQAHGAEAAKRGTGLGLAISHKLVALMGGELEVASEAGIGSTFAFSLPLATADDLPPGSSQAAAATTLGGRILVVEDSKANQLLATSQLKRLGYESVVAESGEVALDVLTTETFDAILMDWNMPGIDGLETTRRWRIREAERDIEPTPVIAMTANAMASDREQCLAAGMDDFLSKPVGLDDISVMLGRWVRGASGAVPLGLGDPADDPSGLIDQATLDALERDIGDPAVVVALISAFLEEMPSRDEQLAGWRDDVDQARRAAHTIKSAAASLGARQLSAAAKSVEAALRNGQGSQSEIDQARSLIADSCKELNRYLEVQEEAA